MDRHTQPVHFLLVEDDEDHADLIARAMRDNRLFNKITLVTDGQAAIDFLHHKPPYEEAERPDIILLDIQLPILSGHEVLEAIKSDPDTATIPVVILSTSDNETDRQQAYKSGANSYLVKPLDFQSFHHLVKHLNLYWGILNQPPR
ncbi:response regulator [Mucisphaera calidilacus]|uniref:Response regulator rcp1 n=1 Tax=Mucisphaera calidilacus TaxID=2527982 RepID=A0A518BUA3_9BACT|nr:response regulator [Mucisphaera calidilacus]QDU70514.1 Response regulator rcp1 [Mucisphaera calidilacus]